MVETDCPYLAPVPYRGKRCEPAYTRLVAEKIAEVRQSSLEAIAAVTTRTAQGFFGYKTGFAALGGSLSPATCGV